MPLDALLPVIDDRAFSDIVDEARTRIPRYTPEWTDLNDNDPGMAMVQLLGWMTDLLIYRLGKVPQQNYIKFLELIGIELNAAQPAQAEVTFPVTAGYSQTSVIVPMGTQVATAGQPPVIFELPQALIALTAPLVTLLSFDGFQFTDLTSDNQQADETWYPFGVLANTGSALMLGFDATNPLPAIDLELAFYLSEQASSPNASNCTLPQSQVYPPVTLAWQYWDGSSWSPLRLLKDGTNALLATGHVHLQLPSSGMASASFNGSASLYWIRASITAGGYDQAPTLQALRTNTAVVRQSQTVANEVLGGSNGQPNQSLTLQNAPVLDGTLVLQVDAGDGNGFITWALVSDFFSSGPNDLVYRLDRTTATVLFGDGVNGSIPAINISNRGGNITALTYSFGGGASGNVAAGAINAVLSSLDGIDESKVGNLFAAYGGADEETLQEVTARAPSQIKSRCRAVTADDFQYLALQVANIQRAYAMPLAHPSFPGIQVPGAVSVIVVPGGTSPDPTPSDGTIRTVCAYLSQRKLITTELFVVKPTYVELSVTTSVIVENNADLASTQTQIEQALLTYFHPLTGGDDGQGWPFGGSVYYSRVFQQILSVPGVQRIQSMTFTLGGTNYPACTDASIPAAALVFSTEHTVEVDYDTSS